MVATATFQNNSLWPHSNNAHDHARVVNDCLNTLRIFISPGQVTQLVALDVTGPGCYAPTRYAGFFDYDHLDLMAREAADFSGRSKGVYFTLNPLKPEVRDRCPNRVQRAQQGVLACDADVLRRSWLMIDFDPRRPAGVSASDVEKRLAFDTLRTVSSYLSSYLFPNAIIGNSGNGYHLYYRVDLRPDDQRPHRILKMLDQEFGSEAVKIDTSVAKASQLTKLFGTLSSKGPPSIDRPHRYSALQWVPNCPIVSDELLSGILASSAPLVVPNSPGAVDQTVIERARRYIAKMPPSISGQHGHDRLFEAACRLVKGFGLSVTEALPLIRKYNERAIPNWNEEDLVRKLEQAIDREDPRPSGYLLHRETQPTVSIQANSHPVKRDDEALPPLPGPMFPVSVPDFVPVPTAFVTECLQHQFIELPRGRPKFECYNYTLWLAFYAIFEQRESPAWIPDALIASGIGGASPQKDWQSRFVKLDGQKRLSVEAERREVRRLRKELLTLIPVLRETVARGSEAHDVHLIERTEQIISQKMELERRIPTEHCPDCCLMHSSGVKHEHYMLRLSDAHWGELRELAAMTPEGQVQFDFNKKVEGQSKTILENLVRSNKVHRAYLPVQLCGQAAGLNVRQIRLIQGLIRERTRTKRNGENRSRKSQEELIRNASVRAARQDATIQCPYLDSNETYIAFGGNMKELSGRGYRLFGNFHQDLHRQGGWLRRLGYPVLCDTDEERIWNWISIMLGDLSFLRPSMGIVAAAVDTKGRWHSLDELREMVKEARYRSWLKTCSLRIFAPADYLVRWRHWFAARLGFSYIPGGDWSAPVGASRLETSNPPAEMLRAQMKALGIKAKQLASRMVWSESRVSRQLNGKSSLSPELVAVAQELILEVSQNELHDAQNNP